MCNDQKCSIELLIREKNALLIKSHFNNTPCWINFFSIFRVGIFITHNNDKDALPAVDIFKHNTNTGKRYWNTGFQITNMQLFWYNYGTCFRLQKNSCLYTKWFICRRFKCVGGGCCNNTYSKVYFITYKYWC